MYPADLYRPVWKPLHESIVDFGGVECYIVVREFYSDHPQPNNELLMVELAPVADEDRDDSKWPVDVLALPMEAQKAILDQVERGEDLPNWEK